MLTYSEWRAQNPQGTPEDYRRYVAQFRQAQITAPKQQAPKTWEDLLSGREFGKLKKEEREQLQTQVNPQRQSRIYQSGTVGTGKYATPTYSAPSLYATDAEGKQLIDPKTKKPILNEVYNTSKFQDAMAGVAIGNQVAAGSNDPFFRLGAVAGAAIAGLFTNDLAGYQLHMQAQQMAEKETEQALAKTKAAQTIESQDLLNQQRQENVIKLQNRNAVLALETTDLNNDAQLRNLGHQAEVITTQLMSTPADQLVQINQYQNDLKGIVAKAYGVWGLNPESVNDMSPQQLLASARNLTFQKDSKPQKMGVLYYRKTVGGNYIPVTGPDGRPMVDEKAVFSIINTEMKNQRADAMSKLTDQDLAELQTAAYEAAASGAGAIDPKTKKFTPLGTKYFAEQYEARLKRKLKEKTPDFDMTSMFLPDEGRQIDVMNLFGGGATQRSAAASQQGEGQLVVKMERPQNITAEQKPIYDSVETTYASPMSYPNLEKELKELEAVKNRSQAQNNRLSVLQARAGQIKPYYVAMSEKYDSDSLKSAITSVGKPDLGVAATAMSKLDNLRFQRTALQSVGKPVPAELNSAISVLEKQASDLSGVATPPMMAGKQSTFAMLPVSDGKREKNWFVYQSTFDMATDSKAAAIQNLVTSAVREQGLNSALTANKKGLRPGVWVDNLQLFNNDPTLYSVVYLEKPPRIIVAKKFSAIHK